MSGTADGANAWANNEVGVAWTEKAIHRPPKILQRDFIRKKRICNGADGISDIEGKAATVAGSERVSKSIGKSMLLQELMQVFGQLAADAFG